MYSLAAFANNLDNFINTDINSSQAWCINGDVDLMPIVCWLLCQDREQNKACGKCQSCVLLNSNTHSDCYQLHPDVSSNVIKVAAIRDLIGFTNKSLNYANCKIVLINKAETMNLQAANAFLKTLEDPVSKVLFLLATDKVDLLLPTIKSRCQTLDFHKNHHIYDPNILAYIAEKLRVLWIENNCTLSVPELAKELCAEPISSLHHIYLIISQLLKCKIQNQSHPLLALANPWLLLDDIVKAISSIYQGQNLNSQLLFENILLKSKI